MFFCVWKRGEKLSNLLGREQVGRGVSLFFLGLEGA